MQSLTATDVVVGTGRLPKVRSQSSGQRARQTHSARATPRVWTFPLAAVATWRKSSARSKVPAARRSASVEVMAADAHQLFLVRDGVERPVGERAALGDFWGACVRSAATRRAVAASVRSSARSRCSQVPTVRRSLPSAKELCSGPWLDYLEIQDGTRVNPSDPPKLRPR